MVKSLLKYFLVFFVLAIVAYASFSVIAADYEDPCDDGGPGCYEADSGNSTGNSTAPIEDPCDDGGPGCYTAE